MNAEVLLTNKELCVGCNKCIAKCLVKANVAFRHNGENKVKVDQNKCIHCGSCIAVCDHKARDFADDTERFFFDLKRGINLSVIADPAIRFNFPNYKRLYGYLKALKVKSIYDVAIGADITVWAYLKVIEEQKLDSIIAQLCPVTVSYIQKYHPEVIKNLAPIHSPMMCTAIYLKKYNGIQDKIAFLSPCIGKIDEITEKYAEGFVNYNVTFEKIERYLKINKIDLINYQELECDEVGFDLAFSGEWDLRKNLELYTHGEWIKQVEGPERSNNYLNEYAQRLFEGKHLPLVVMISNCEYGCNIGTGTCKSITSDDIDYKINQLKKDEMPKRRQTTLKKESSVFELFDKQIQLSDFARQYEDRSLKIDNTNIANLEHIFNQLHKTTEASRNINCYACGFGNCLEFAMAVANGTNHVKNCIDLNRKELVAEKERLSKTNKEVKQLHYLATHDFLTEIPNRYYLEEHLKKLIISETSKQNESALLFMDLDNFKVVNDSFGHASGDQILLNVVDRLQLNLGQEAFLARLGGDEFAIVLRNTSLEQASAVANQLLEALRIEDFKVEGNQVTIKVTASIGIMMIDGTLNTQTLFSYADVALYTAKDEGKNRISSVQSGGDIARLSETNKTILQINDALKENRFILFFQPVIKMEGTIIHHEALLRMLDREDNLIFPDEFLPIAERFGLMSQIDRWVVNSALEVLGKRLELSVFVNISASSLGDGELLKFIEARIDESNIQPSRIGFEITETAAIKDLDQAEHWIRRLKLKGCKFALDDFGVGFLTFTHLQRLPVDYLKIDGSFIRNLDVNHTNKALVKAINAVAHALGKATIAEYVESEGIWSILRGLQIDFGQGYFLGKPAPISRKTNKHLSSISP